MKDKLLESIRSRFKLLEADSNDWDSLLFDPPGYVSRYQDEEEEDEPALEPLEKDMKKISGPLYHGSHLDRSKEISKVKWWLRKSSFTGSYR